MIRLFGNARASGYFTTKKVKKLLKGIVFLKGQVLFLKWKRTSSTFCFLKKWKYSTNVCGIFCWLAELTLWPLTFLCGRGICGALRTRIEIKQQNSHDVLVYFKTSHRANVILMVMGTYQWETSETHAAIWRCWQGTVNTIGWYVNCYDGFSIIFLELSEIRYRSGMVNSKSSVGKVLLRVKR